MELTYPLLPEDLQAAYPRETRSMATTELEQKLEMLEHALRSDFGVTRTDDDATAALRVAMLSAWPSFLLQLHQTGAERVGADGASHTTAAPGAIGWPAFIGRSLVALVGEGTVVPHVTQLVR